VGKIPKHPPITVVHILPVKHNLQGHPEFPRLWATMIHKILTGPDLKFTSAAHEPCLYQVTVEGIPIYLLRQVDNFTVITPTVDISNKLFGIIQKVLTQPLKLLGILTIYNGLAVT